MYFSEHEDECYDCGDGGELIMCSKTGCSKCYHLSCLTIDKIPHGNWLCPWHFCDDCGKAAMVRCQECSNSFCLAHAPGQITKMADGRYLCDQHPESGRDTTNTPSVPDETSEDSENTTNVLANPGESMNSPEPLNPSSVCTDRIDVPLSPTHAPTTLTNASSDTANAPKVPISASSNTTNASINPVEPLCDRSNPSNTATDALIAPTNTTSDPTTPTNVLLNPTNDPTCFSSGVDVPNVTPKDPDIEDQEKQPVSVP